MTEFEQQVGDALLPSKEAFYGIVESATGSWRRDFGGSAEIDYATAVAVLTVTVREHLAPRVAAAIVAAYSNYGNGQRAALDVLRGA